jgi:hypothetical protein
MEPAAGQIRGGGGGEGWQGTCAGCEIAYKNNSSRYRIGPLRFAGLQRRKGHFRHRIRSISIFLSGSSSFAARKPQVPDFARQCEREHSAPSLSRFRPPPAADSTASTLSGLYNGVLAPRCKPPTCCRSRTRPRRVDRPHPPLPDLAPTQQSPPRRSWSTAPSKVEAAGAARHRRPSRCCCPSRSDQVD